MTLQQLIEIEKHLTSGLSVIRRTRDRLFLREAVTRIRHIRGLIELRT